MRRLVTKTKEQRDHQLSIRIPKRIRDALEVDAEHERRSIADIINILLEQRYAARSMPNEKGATS